MQTVFIRHNWHRFEKDQPELNKAMVPKLFKEDLIGIHFQKQGITDSDKLNPERWVNSDDEKKAKYGKNALEIMCKIAKESTLVFASYAGPNGNHIKLGKIEPQEIRLVPVIDRLGFYIKALKLSKVKPSSAPILLAIQPTQGTIVEWSKNPRKYDQKIKILECLYEGVTLPQEVGSLIPAQQEVLCYEYLRKHGFITHLLLPIGRGLEDIDIYGNDKDGKEVVAQVTFSGKKNKIKKKVDALNKYKEFKKYLFTMKESYDSGDEIMHFNLSKVFEDMAKDGNGGLVDKMLNYATSETNLPPNDKFELADAGKIARL